MLKIAYILLNLGDVMSEKSWVYGLAWVCFAAYIAFLFYVIAFGAIAAVFSPILIISSIALVVVMAAIYSLHRQRKNNKEDAYYTKNIYK